VQLLSELKITGAISAQIEHFLAGFHAILPKAYIALFNEYEIELLISGSPEINVADWQENTSYIGFTKDDAIIQWFWVAVQQFTQDQKAHLLQFVSGTARVPLGGFSQLRGVDGITKFTITKAVDASLSSLPTASTW
jgi:hypothetical protein